MPIEEVAYKNLIAARETLLKTLKKELTDDEKAFLVSIKSGEPNWSAMGIKGTEIIYLVSVTRSNDFLSRSPLF